MEEEAWRNMVLIVGLALPCYLSKWFPIVVGWGCCGRKWGVVGLSTSPGTGLEHVQIVVEWTLWERHNAPVCVRNESKPRPEAMLRPRPRPFHYGFPMCQNKEERCSQQRWGDGVRAWKHSHWEVCVHGSPQFPKKTWGLESWVWPKVSKRLRGEQVEVVSEVTQHPAASGAS